MTEFWFIRHGESVANRGDSIITESPANIPLTEQGIAQAHKVAPVFPYVPTRIVTSVYIRTHHTAQPTMTRFPDVPVEQWAVEEITFLSPVTYANSTIEQRRPPARAWWANADPLHVDGAGAESFSAFIARAQDMQTRLRKFANRTKSQSETPIVAIFTHQTYIQAVMWSLMLMDVPVDSAYMTNFRAYSQSFHVPNCAILKVNYAGKHIRTTGILTDHLR